MLEGLLHQVPELVLVSGKAPCHKGCARAYGHQGRVERFTARAFGMDLGDKIRGRGGRCLPLGETIDPVVTGQDNHIEVAPRVMDEMVSAFCVEAPVSGNGDQLGLVVGHVHAEHHG